MKTQRRIIFSLFLASAAFAASSVMGQSDKLETERGLTEAIAPFAAAVRTDILVASGYPETLKQLRNSQTQTAESFQKIIGRFRQQKQEWFYTITRYPDLMHRLATLPPKQKREDINRLLPQQEPALQEAAWRLYRSEKKNLARLDNIRLNADVEFEKSTAHLNARGREAFRDLQSKPDVLTLLTNNIELTARLGEHYRSRPTDVSNQLASMHDQWVVQNERDETAFKKHLENDPKAMKELRQASNAYRGSGYYNYNNPYYYPYSYWFGYPYWYGYPMWYPGMFWSPGFYFGVGGLYGYPSYGFSFWFYNGGYYNYPHLYSRLGVYYRTNLNITRTSTFNRSAFMNAATSHYRPDAAARLSSPYAYHGSTNIQNRNWTNHLNTNMYRAQPWGTVGGRGLGGSVGGGFHGVHVGRR